MSASGRDHMDINDILTVRLQVTDAAGTVRDCPVIASGLLAYEDYSEADWDRFVPWRGLDLVDVVPPGISTPRQVVLDVEEVRSGRCRRVVTQILAMSRVTISWDDLTASPGRFDVVLDLTEPQGAAQIARLEADAGEVALASHVRVRGDHLEDLLDG
jgi:hypothetical protein